MKLCGGKEDETIHLKLLVMSIFRFFTRNLVNV